MFLLALIAFPKLMIKLLRNESNWCAMIMLYVLKSRTLVEIEVDFIYLSTK